MRFASRRARWAAAAAAAIGLGQFSGVVLAADALASPFVRSYTAPNGESYLSVSLEAPDLPATATPHDHVILVDTSASQVGEYRRHAYAVVQQMLSALPAEDRVQVLAVDTRATPLTSGFLTPREAAAEAIPALNRRVPAGATNLFEGLSAAAKLFDHSRGASITLIGDGMSAAHLIQKDELNELMESMRSSQIAIHSYAVGSRKDMQLLGVLATQTGGVVKQDHGESSAEVAGRELAEAARLPVFYPTTLDLAWTGVEVLPSMALPMRADRSTVYLAHGNVTPDAKLSVTGRLNGADRTFTWSIGQPKQTSGTTVLGHLWQEAAADDGLAMPLAGDELISYAQATHLDRVEALETEGAAALKAGRRDVAEQVGKVLQSLEPGHVSAVAFQVPDAEAVNPQGVDEPPAPGTVDRLAPREQPAPIGSIAAEEARRQALAGKLRLELQNEITAARNMVELDPAAAQDRLEQALATVKGATEIEAEQQQQLLRMAVSALDQVKARRASLESARAAQQKAIAQLRAAEQLTDRLASDERTLKNLVDQVRAAMSDGYHGDSAAFEEAEGIGRIVFSRAPGSAMGSATVFVPEAAGALDQAARLRALRSDKFLAQLHQVELSHVPFPDEPPINYPPAEVWQYITQLRSKWKSVDLHKNSPNEERIYEALNRDVNFQFIGTPLEEVIRYIETENRITIRPDVTTLQDVGVPMDSEINLVMSGISLRAALKLLLENVNGQKLAYLIEDEVMKITTDEKAKEILQVRVYPVADIVIAPMTQMMMAQMFGGGGMGGGMMGGGMGGMGGGMGGMGGGMGGMGGGMGGMGGMGGGFMSIPTAPLQGAQGLKKKP